MPKENEYNDKDELDSLERDLIKRFCACQKIDPRSSWPHASSKYGTAHLRGCPMHIETRSAVERTAKTIAEEISDLRRDLRKAKAKVDGAKKPQLTEVRFDDYYFRAAAQGGVHKIIDDEEWSTVIYDLAEALSARTSRSTIWTSSNDPDSRLSKPIQERYQPKDKTYPSYMRDAQLSNGFERADDLAIFPTKERAEMFLKLGRKVRRLLDAAYEMGRYDGGDLLQQLAQEKITPQKFYAEFEGRRKRGNDFVDEED